MSPAGQFGTDPVWCEEYGYGLGRPNGVLVLKYRSAGVLDFGERRQDLLHQFYWAPGGVLSARHGLNAQFIGTREAFWVHRAVTHDVRVTGTEFAYRVFLREVPPALDSLRAGAISIDPEATRLLQAIARPDHDEAQALEARAHILAGLGASTRELAGHHPVGAGFATTVARALAHDPGDPTRLEEWASRLHISAKTLQRDFVREFGTSYTRWRTSLRLRAAHVLVETQPVATVARRVGYASVSAFVAAFAKEFGYTPGVIGRGAIGKSWHQTPRDEQEAS